MRSASEFASCPSPDGNLSSPAPSAWRPARPGR